MTERLEINKMPFLMRPESFMLFTGAGLSVSSGLPLWSEIKDNLLRRVFFYLPTSEDREQSFLETYKTLISKEEQQPGGYLMPEYVTQAFTLYFGRMEHEKLFRDLLGGEPSDTYLWLSQLCVSSAIKRYATVNLDEMLENALLILEMREKFKWQVFCAGDSIPSPSIFVLHKLHGTISRYDTWCITPDRLMKFDPEQNTLLSAHSAGVEYILFYGYSGRDKDVENFFREWLDSPAASRLKEVWFCSRHPWRDKPPLASAFENWGINVRHKITPENSALFFKSWAHKVGIANLRPFESISIGERKRVFSYFSSDETYVKPSYYQPDVLEKHFSDYPVVTSASSPFILAGDYGIYMGGQEIFFTLPIRTWLGIRPSQKTEFSVRITPALNDIYGIDYLTDISSRFDTVLNKIISYIYTLPPFSDHLKDLNGLSVKLYTEIPPRTGLEDNLTVLMLIALEALWAAETRNCVGPLSQLIPNILPTLFEAEYKRRPETGYLHLLPAITGLQASGKRIVIADRSEKLPDIRRGLDYFENENSPDKVQPNTLLLNCRTLPIDKQTHRISLAVLPRAPLPGTPSVPTREAVRKLLRQQQAKGFGGLHALSILTGSVRQSIETAFEWSKIGPVLSAYQCLLHSIERSSYSANTLLGRLLQEPSVAGCKCSGAGPGGAMLIISEIQTSPRTDSLKTALREVGAGLYIDHIEQIDDNRFTPIRFDKLPC